MANGRGGARPGAGRKKKALSEKILEGNRSKEPLTKLQFDNLPSGDLKGENMPPVAEYLKQKTKNTNNNIAPQVFEETWKWLNERGCADLVKKELIEQYAMNIARWIQCEEGVNQFGLLAKHPTTGNPIQSPYHAMAINCQKQANIIWIQIFQIVKENCETPINGNGQDDIMEKILRGNV